MRYDIAYAPQSEGTTLFEDNKACIILAEGETSSGVGEQARRREVQVHSREREERIGTR